MLTSARIGESGDRAIPLHWERVIDCREHEGAASIPEKLGDDGKKSVEGEAVDIKAGKEEMSV